MARGVRIGDYLLEQELAVSPFAFLYRAVHSVLPRHALVKVARSAGESLAVLREACLLEALPHPGVVRVYETGRLSDSRTWFAHEDVEGMTLADALEAPESELVEPAVAIAMIRDVAEILAHAHQRGVFHCAITPESLVVARGRGFPICVADWSAARAHDAAGQPSGEPSPFTSPELAAGDAIDDRADVWSLGVIAYRAIAGKMPFEAPVTSPASGLFVPIEVHIPGMPRELATLLDSMLAFDRWDRPTAAEVRAALAVTTVEVIDKPIEMLRIRKPRWTPQIDLGTKLVDHEPSVIVSPDIDKKS